MNVFKFVFVTTVLCVNLVSCIDDGLFQSKVSLTFVIDDTGSMTDDIDQVIKGSNAIFDTVMNSEKSQIENFVLVTFNDPETKVRSITKKRDVFKHALSSINVDGGGDCPEYAMSGIKEALKNSLPGSYLYVFTDASAKDYKLYEDVENMASQLRSQIVFVLTGICDSESSADYQVYHKLAKATGGEVFHLEKQEINEILGYVRYTIEAPTSPIATGSFPPGYGHKFNYSTDVKTKDPLITVTGEKPVVDITGPDGTKPTAERIVDTDKITIVKLPDAKPGVHTVEVGSRSETSVKVVARSEVQFNFGFSTFVPSSFKDVTTRPVPDTTSYISIKITEGDLHMKTVKVLELDETVIDEIPLSILDEDDKLYVTKLTELPKTMFKIAVTGYDPASDSTITRIASSPVEPQRVTGSGPVNKPPKVTSDKDKVTSVYDDNFKLICKVSGFPKPDIIWVDEDGTRLTAKDSIAELPYDYISILNIEHARTNTTYYCKASNKLGEDTKPFTVEVNRKRYINVLEKPKDTEIEFNAQGELFCKVESYPESQITWYKDGNRLPSRNGTIELKDNNSVLKIKNMQPDDVGIYLCEIRNDDGRKLLQATVSISGIESPLIDKTTSEVHVNLHSDIVIDCKVLKGTPPPSISWYKSNFIGEEMEIIEAKDEDRLTVRNAQKIDKGIITCEAENDIGTDYHEIKLIVDYPPVIKTGLKYMRIKEGDDVLLSCDVDGEPAPDVVWSKNDQPLLFKGIVFENKSLQITSATVDDSGNYTCTAFNNIGAANKTMFVDVYVPVKISRPENNVLQFKVGSELLLPCSAEGFPKPHITWSYHSFNSSSSKIIKHELSSYDSTFSLVNRIQIAEEGYYTCKASNVGSMDSITYEVHVLAPPIIENTYAEKIFKPVEGDLVLRIKCKASGNPKPTIRWLKDGLYVAIGDSYNIDNGTLVIKNIEKDSSGVYVCEAKNDMGTDTEMYEVEVRTSPLVKSPAVTVLIEYGTTSTVECKVPHKKTDRLRWYKHGKLIEDGELTIRNAEASDSGIYTCRVSDFFKSKSDSVKVHVGYKPTFVTREKENVEMVPGSPQFLSCEARGVPKPEITWWLNKAKINSSEMILSIDYSVHNKGVYYCSVRNHFGSIYRRFIVSPRDCAIELAKMKSNLQPLMLSSTSSTFHIDNGHLIIPKDGYVTLFCPTKFKKLPKSYVTAFCDGGSKLKFYGVSHEYSDIECTEPYNYVVKPTGEKCLPGNTEIFKVGFEALHKTIEVYEVCFNHGKRIPIYTKHYMPKTAMEADVEGNWTIDDVFENADLNAMYECNNQIQTISSSLAKWFHRDDQCCFRKRQLVNQKDVTPGVTQRAVFSYLNVVPQWSTCNGNNWDDIEKAVRSLSQSSYSDLLVWSGIAGGLVLTSNYGTDTNIYLTDGRLYHQPIPKYLWKVIQNPATRSSVAIIQVNVPDLKSSDVHKYVRCPNICNRIEWMQNSHWNDIDRGLVYCCSLQEFEKAFAFTSVFEPHYEVLSKADSFAV